MRKFFPTDCINYEKFPTPQDVIPLAFDMISALNYLHKQHITGDNLKPSHPIVHGNLKPANIFLYPVASPSCQPWFVLTDFGLATESDAIPMRRPDSYLAPETYTRYNRRTKANQDMDRNWPAHKRYTPEADIWSLGIVLLEMVAKVEATKWYSPRGVYEERVALKMAAVGDGIPAELARVLRGMLCVRPKERKSAGELAGLLPRRPDIREDMG